MAAFNFPSGDALRIYQRVYTPLSESLDSIKESKKTYGSLPYVKLRTHSEENPQALEVYARLIANNSYLTPIIKAYTGTWNLTSNALSSWSWGYLNTWKCKRQMTATALKTAITAFSLGIKNFKENELSHLNEASLQDLQKEIVNITQTLENARKTIFYIYRTYDQKIEEDQVDKEDLTDSGPKEIREQYQALTRLIKEEIASLSEVIEQKLQELSPSIPTVSTPTIEPEASPSEKISVKDESRLIFKNEERASLWFTRQLNRHRNEAQVTGMDAFHNFESKKRNMEKKAPKDFINFAKTWDAVFEGDDVRNYDAAKEVFERFSALLSSTEDIKLSLSPPLSFKHLLKELCSQNAPRGAYQLLFRSLQNEAGTAPIGLKYEAALLNAIMSHGGYFPMFDV